MERIHSYPSIFGMGHKALRDVNFFGMDNLVVQIKVDGSQFSFTKLEDGNILFRSKGADILPGAVPNLFQRAVDAVYSLSDKLVVGHIYRGECINALKHNSLTYKEIPQNHVALFDIEIESQNFLPPNQVRSEAERIGFGIVPTVHTGPVKSVEHVMELFKSAPHYLGVEPEGLVFKAYGVYGPDKKTFMAKYVTEAFKEVHRKEWGESNPSVKDVVQQLIDELKTEARWNKAIQHLRDAGQLTETPKDIGPLLKEISADIRKEEEEYIKARLFKWAWERIGRGVVAGFPQWYKDKLVADTFAGTEGQDRESYSDEQDRNNYLTV